MKTWLIYINYFHWFLILVWIKYWSMVLMSLDGLQVVHILAIQYRKLKLPSSDNVSENLSRFKHTLNVPFDLTVRSEFLGASCIEDNWLIWVRFVDAGDIYRTNYVRTDMSTPHHGNFHRISRTAGASPNSTRPIYNIRPIGIQLNANLGQTG